MDTYYIAIDMFLVHLRCTQQRKQDYKYRCEYDQKFFLSTLLRQSCFEPFPCDPVFSRDISIDQKQPHRAVNFIVIPDEYFEPLLTTLWFNRYVFPVGASMHLHLEFTFLLAGRNLYVTKQIIHTHTYNQRYFTNVNTNDRVSFVIFSIDTPPTLSCSSSGHVLPREVQLRSFREKPERNPKHYTK